MATAKKSTKKSPCAVKLGRKGGLASKAAKKGIHSPAYKKKIALKKSVAKNKTAKKVTSQKKYRYSWKVSPAIAIVYGPNATKYEMFVNGDDYGGYRVIKRNGKFTAYNGRYSEKKTTLQAAKNFLIKEFRLDKGTNY